MPKLVGYRQSVCSKSHSLIGDNSLAVVALPHERSLLFLGRPPARGRCQASSVPPGSVDNRYKCYKNSFLRSVSVDTMAGGALPQGRSRPSDVIVEKKTQNKPPYRLKRQHATTVRSGGRRCWTTKSTNARHWGRKERCRSPPAAPLWYVRDATISIRTTQKVTKNKACARTLRAFEEKK